LQQKAGHRSGKCPGFSPDELRVAFSIPSGSLFLVNHPVYKMKLAPESLLKLMQKEMSKSLWMQKGWVKVLRYMHEL
jgi:hypothetical protein